MFQTRAKKSDVVVGLEFVFTTAFFAVNGLNDSGVLLTWERHRAFCKTGGRCRRCFYPLSFVDDLGESLPGELLMQGSVSTK